MLHGFSTGLPLVHVGAPRIRFCMELSIPPRSTPSCRVSWCVSRLFPQARWICAGARVFGSAGASRPTSTGCGFSRGQVERCTLARSELFLLFLLVSSWRRLLLLSLQSLWMRSQAQHLRPRRPQQVPHPARRPGRRRHGALRRRRRCSASGPWLDARSSAPHASMGCGAAHTHTGMPRPATPVGARARAHGSGCCQHGGRGGDGPCRGAAARPWR